VALKRVGKNEGRTMSNLDPAGPAGGTSSKSPRSKRRRKRLWTAAGVAGIGLGLLVAKPAILLVRTVWHDRADAAQLPEGHLDDASRLNATPVAEVWAIPSDAEQAVAGLRGVLERARRNGQAVSIAGARHSMGGQSLARDGIVIDMLPLKHMDLNETQDVLHVGAGARWDDVIAFLDRHGRSVGVMQSNNSFTVGGSISVNCHGWQHNHAPIAATVESLRLMTADGVLHDCSREREPELFGLALGGYGLIGVILDVDLRVVPNERYRIERFAVPTPGYVAEFNERAADPDAALAYGRLCIVPERLCEEAILTVFYRDASGDGGLPPLTDPGLDEIRRAIFRGSAESDYGKELRWSAETQLHQHVSGRFFSRNQLLNEGVEVFQDRSAGTTDILHEYFVPAGEFEPFCSDVREIVRRHDANLLNITVRNVTTDNDTFLRYADRDLFALVMLYSQPRTSAGETEMQEMTRELIDAALARGGRFYLPYRLHATDQQLRRAYPQFDEFLTLKRRYDPDAVFQNSLFRRYAAHGSTP
jgi:FAD/FMN-containing dehydrogenase